jgi:multiple sugar transport system ATP-binding protein
MKDGRIQQIAPPGEIYRKPANLFVAEFVGMPRINLLPARIVNQNGNCWLEIEDFKFSAAKFSTQAGVVAAVRPEDVHIFLAPEPDALEFQVYSVLPSGPELFIQAMRRKRIMIIRETRQLDLKMDQPIWLKINPSDINLYDEASGNLLALE